MRGVSQLFSPPVHGAYDNLNFVKNITLARAVPLGNTGAIPRKEVLVSWSKPNEGWVMVNYDGSSIGNLGSALARGLFRDTGGVWLVGFGVNLGICSSVQDELWAALIGLSFGLESRLFPS